MGSDSLANPEFWSRFVKISVKKKDTPVCDIKNPEFWSLRIKILVKKKDTSVCDIDIPEFWSHHIKIPVKKKDTPVLKTSIFRNTKLITTEFFSFGNF